MRLADANTRLPEDLLAQLPLPDGLSRSVDGDTEVLRFGRRRATSTVHIAGMLIAVISILLMLFSLTGNPAELAALLREGLTGSQVLSSAFTAALALMGLKPAYRLLNAVFNDLELQLGPEGLVVEQRPIPARRRVVLSRDEIVDVRVDSFSLFSERKRWEVVCSTRDAGPVLVARHLKSRKLADYLAGRIRQWHGAQRPPAPPSRLLSEDPQPESVTSAPPSPQPVGDTH